jgi:hypothetical protein
MPIKSELETAKVRGRCRRRNSTPAARNRRPGPGLRDEGAGRNQSGVFLRKF